MNEFAKVVRKMRRQRDERALEIEQADRPRREHFEELSRQHALFDRPVKRLLRMMGAAVFGRGFLGLGNYSVNSECLDYRRSSPGMPQWSVAGYWQLHGPMDIIVEVRLRREAYNTSANVFDVVVGRMVKGKIGSCGGKSCSATETALADALKEMVGPLLEMQEKRGL
jgi:hypothetical protein